ncbi:MAG TPA: DUF3566 domain-containing protein [Acidimicrobiia bacterium]|nr:DUF3566 domain-containing protein [Acidimicrobiia bacterium]
MSSESTAALQAPDGDRPSRRSRRRKSASADAGSTDTSTGADAKDGARSDAKSDDAAKPAAKAAATPTTDDKTDAKATPTKAASTKQAASDDTAPAPPRRGARTGTDIPAAASVNSLDAPSLATSEADAEAELVDDTVAPPRRRFGRFGRTVSASIPAVPAVESAPITVVPAKPITGPTTTVSHADRKYRQTITKVDLWSVTKLSLCFYLSAMFVTVVAFVALWIIADAAGIIHSVEKFLGDLLSAKNFHFLSATVLRGAILIGLVVVALQVVITVIAASFYNIFAELFGGVEITVKEEGPAEYLDPSLGL